MSEENFDEVIDATGDELEDEYEEYEKNGQDMPQFSLSEAAATQKLRPAPP